MKYAIYQLKEKDTFRYQFMPYDFAKKNGFSFDDYEKIYEGKHEKKKKKYVLEVLFNIFNTAHPKDFKGHSLSVSDILMIIDNEGNKSFHYCDTLGWKDITKEINV